MIPQSAEPWIRAREWLYLWTEAEGVALKERRGCEYVRMTEAALLSRLAEQWKSICHREQTERHSIKVRGGNKRDTGEGQRRKKRGRKKRQWKSWLKAASVFCPTPWLSSPPLCPAGSKRKQSRSAEREAEGELSRACCSNAGLRNSKTFRSCAYTQTHTNTHMLLFSWWYKYPLDSERGRASTVRSLRLFPVDYLAIKAPAKGRVTRRGWGLKRDGR